MSKDNTTGKTQGKTASSKNTKSSIQKANDKKVTEPVSSADRQIPREHIDNQQLKNALVETVPAEYHSKKWNHYLFDFIMLFLAITAGFFVDNKREVYMERNGEISVVKKGVDH